MAELGIDFSGQTSKTLDRYLGEPFAWVITVCDRARESCPVFAGADETGHWAFDDPSEATGPDEERMAVYRRVRDEIAEPRSHFRARRWPRRSAPSGVNHPACLSAAGATQHVEPHRWQDR